MAATIVLYTTTMIKSELSLIFCFQNAAAGNGLLYTAARGGAGPPD